MIRQLLRAAHPSRSVPASIEVPDTTPSGEMSPETYLGYQRLQYLAPSNNVARDAQASYHFPRTLPLGGFGLSGTWTDHAQEATAGAGAELELAFVARDVYLVLGGRGTISVFISGHHAKTIEVRGPPRLYTLINSRSTVTAKLLLRPSPGVRAYAFTFG
jgi:hypothetical protein